jgi:flagellar protein FliO/FliZ
MKPAGLAIPLAAYGACAGAADALPSAGASLLQAIVGLALVLALIGAAAWVMRRIGTPLSGSAGLLRTVASAALGPRERVVVIEIGDQWLVLGVTQQNVTPLHAMPKGQLPAPGPGAMPAFAALLERARSRHAPR